jgi:hypothetical protein
MRVMYANGKSLFSGAIARFLHARIVSFWVSLVGEMILSSSFRVPAHYFLTLHHLRGPFHSRYDVHLS